MPRVKADEIYIQKMKDFYDSLMAGDYKVDRFHELARQKGLPSSVVSQALEKNKAPLLFTFVNLRSRDNVYRAEDVKDDSNCNFILKLMATIGLVVPPTAIPEAALMEIATKYNLLGATAERSDIEAWASREGDLHRGLMQYAIRRSNRNPTSRSWDKNMARIKSMVQALKDENPGLVRRRSRKSGTPRKHGSKTPGRKRGTPNRKDDRTPRYTRSESAGNSGPQRDEILYSKTMVLGEGTSDAESSSGSLCERAEEESPTDDACVSPSENPDGEGADHEKDKDDNDKEKSFPLRSVPESLELAAEESFKSLSGEGGSQHDLMEVQKKLREAANSFCPAEGSAPSDAPQASRGRGRGKGRGRGRSNKKESGGDDGDDGANEPGEAASSDADLDQEDAKLKEDLSEGEDKPAAPGKEATPKKKPGSRKRRAAKTPTGKTPPKRKRRTPKLKRALKATHEGELESPVLKEHMEAIAQFRKEAAEIQDSRFVVPRELNNVKSFTLPSLSAKGPSIGVLFTTHSFFVGPVEQSRVDVVTEKMGGPKLKVNPSRKSVTVGWVKHGGLPAAWRKACALAGWDPLG